MKGRTMARKQSRTIEPGVAVRARLGALILSTAAMAGIWVGACNSSPSPEDGGRNGGAETEPPGNPDSPTDPAFGQPTVRASDPPPSETALLVTPSPPPSAGVGPREEPDLPVETPFVLPSFAASGAPTSEPLLLVTPSPQSGLSVDQTGS